MNKSIHYWKIAKQSFERLWDSQPDGIRKAIIADNENKGEISQWFYRNVQADAMSKFENEDYEFNHSDSFRIDGYEYLA